MRLHVTFGQSGAGGLMRALELAGRDERVVCLWDNLCIGRLESVEARVAWMYTVLDFEDYAEQHARLEIEWARVLSPYASLVAWFSRTAADEYLGLLELITRRGEHAIDLVDVADLDLPMWTGESIKAPCLGYVSHQLLAGLLERPPARVSAKILEDARTTWPRLKAEDASLRLFGPDGSLVSLPITHFDEALIEATPFEWSTQDRVAGQLLGPRDDAASAGYGFLLDRISELMDSGALESKENPVPDQGWLVRRPPA